MRKHLTDTRPAGMRSFTPYAEFKIKMAEAAKAGLISVGNEPEVVAIENADSNVDMSNPDAVPGSDSALGQVSPPFFQKKITIVADKQKKRGRKSSSTASDDESSAEIEAELADAQHVIDTLTAEFEGKIADQQNTISRMYEEMETLTFENTTLKLLFADFAISAHRQNKPTPRSFTSNTADQEDFPALPPPASRQSTGTQRPAQKQQQQSQKQQQSPKQQQLQHPHQASSTAAVVKPSSTFRATAKKPVLKIPTVDIHTVLVFPIKENDIRTTDMEVKTFVIALAAVLRSNSSPIKPLKVRALNKGGIALDTASKVDQAAMVAMISGSIAFQHVTARAASKLNPRLCIEGIRNEFIPDDVVRSLTQNNPEIFGKRPEAEDLRHVTTRTNNRSPTSVLIIEVTPAIRAKIMVNKTLRFDWCEGIVSDNIFIRQCMKCFAFGHLKNQCDEVTPAVCGCCGEAHLTIECQKKNTAAEIKSCVSCLSHPLYKSSASSHGARDSAKCPTFRSIIRRIQNNIQYV